MARMVRKQIYIEPRQEASLKQLVRETGASEAEIIREAIDRHARVVTFTRRDLAAWTRERAFIADLISSGPVPGGRRWQREELHDR
jgi:hypothetical protein